MLIRFSSAITLYDTYSVLLGLLKSVADDEGVVPKIERVSVTVIAEIVRYRWVNDVPLRVDI